MSHPLIRQATLPDLERMHRIWEEGSGNAGVSPERTTPQDRANIEAFFKGRILGQTAVFQIWVAEAETPTGNKVVAWQALSAFANNPVTRPLFAESSTYVDLSHRSRGIGRSLLLHAMRHSRQAGIRVIVGFVAPSNHRSIKLLESIGWTKRFAFPFSASKVVPDMLLFTFEPFEKEIPE